MSGGVDPHTGPSGHLSPDRRGRGMPAAMYNPISVLPTIATNLTPFLYPVDRGRGAERSEAEWRDLFMNSCRDEQVPRLRFASLGMTGLNANGDQTPAPRLGKSFARFILAIVLTISI